MRKILTFVLTCYILLATCYKPVEAHVGGGPPFLVVDGVYAATNPYYFNDPAINIPQDYTGKTYLVNKPISLSIDLQQLLVPPDIAAKSTFRWTFSEGSSQHEFGTRLEHTYTKPGSYIISLEALAPGETQYVLLDTVELDVLPNAQYKLPTALMAVETTHRQSTKPILFKSTYATDTSTKVKNIIWGFGDGTTATQQNVLHTYTNLQDYSTFPVIFRITDANGFKGYAGVIVEASQGSLHFVNNVGKENTIPVSNTITAETSTVSNKVTGAGPSLLVFIIIGGVIFIVIIAIVFGIIKKNKVSK